MNRSPFVSKITANHLLPLTLLTLFCFGLYFNSLSNGFVFDDYAVIVENKYIQHPIRSIASFFNRSYFNIAGGEASYRPVATLSYYLTHAIAGLNPFLYHLLSVILHTANVGLIYLLFCLILKKRFAALIAAALFACHPALTEAVDCIAYNEDLLAAFFFLLSIICYLNFRTADLKSDIKYYTLSLFFFLLGLLSKEMAITVPAIILLHDVSFKNRTEKQSFSFLQIRNTIRDKWLVYSGYMAVSLIYLYIRFLILYNPEESIKPFYGNLLERIVFLPAHIFSFMKLSFFPLNLTADYAFSYPAIFFAIPNLIGWLIVAGSAFLSFLIFKHSKEIFFAIWWFFITLFPVYNLIPIYNPFAERYLYIPLAGLCMAASVIFDSLINKRLSDRTPIKVLSSVTIIAILGFYSTITISRNRDWKDSLTLWSKTVMTSPTSSIAHGSLGWAFQDQGRLKEAIGEYEKAIKLFPHNYKAYYNLGVIYDQQNDLKDAAANYKSAIEINPAFINAHFNLGNIYHKQGLLEEAIHQFREVTELDPADFEARNNLGVAYARQGNLDRAIAEWKKVLEIDPRNKSAAENISKAKKMMN